MTSNDHRTPSIGPELPPPKHLHLKSENSADRSRIERPPPASRHKAQRRHVQTQQAEQHHGNRLQISRVRPSSTQHSTPLEAASQEAIVLVLREALYLWTPCRSSLSLLPQALHSPAISVASVVRLYLECSIFTLFGVLRLFGGLKLFRDLLQ